MSGFVNCSFFIKKKRKKSNDKLLTPKLIIRKIIHILLVCVAFIVVLGYLFIKQSLSFDCVPSTVAGIQIGYRKVRMWPFGPYTLGDKAQQAVGRERRKQKVQCNVVNGTLDGLGRLVKACL